MKFGGNAGSSCLDRRFERYPRPASGLWFCLSDAVTYQRGQKHGDTEIDKNTDHRYDLGRTRRAVPACGILFSKTAPFIWSGAGSPAMRTVGRSSGCVKRGGCSKKTTAEGAERINELRLTLYLRGLFLPEAFDGEQKAQILEQFPANGCGGGTAAYVSAQLYGTGAGVLRLEESACRRMGPIQADRTVLAAALFRRN